MLLHEAGLDSLLRRRPHEMYDAHSGLCCPNPAFVLHYNLINVSTLKVGKGPGLNITLNL